MHRFLPLLSAIVLTLFIGINGNAQEAYGKIIFEDDFSHESTGTFPLKWKLSEHGGKTDLEIKKYLTIQTENSTNFLSVTKDIGLCIEPNIKLEKADSLCIAFDFQFNNNHALFSLDLCSQASNSNNYCSEVIFYVRDEYNDGISLESYCWDNKYFKGKKTGLPVPALQGTWHHFRIVFVKGSIKCFIDNYRLLSIHETGYIPNYFTICLHGALKFTKFRLTAIGTNYQFEDMLQEKKFITHAINFEKGKSAILPGSLFFR